MTPVLAAIEQQQRLRNTAETRLEQELADLVGPVIASSDWVRQVPEQIAPWVPGGIYALGTDGFGLSEERHVLREYFEVSAEWIAFAALSALAQSDRLTREVALAFAEQAGLDLDKLDPACA